MKEHILKEEHQQNVKHVLKDLLQIQKEVQNVQNVMKIVKHVLKRMEIV